MTVPTIEEWWPRLPETTRTELAASPSSPLSKEAIIAITQVRGVGPAAAYWVDHGPGADRYLLDEEQEWIATNGRTGF